MWLFLQRQMPAIFIPSARPLRMLHLAPEETLRRRLRQLKNLRYVTADLNGSNVMVRLDIMQMPFADGAFDVILCSHVLEHVVDDRAAMRECRRVLGPGGRLLVQIPQNNSRATTLEDPSITTLEAREKHYGQFDHLRLYGRDFAQRLTQQGFRVIERLYADELAAEEGAAFLPRHGLWHDRIYDCWNALDPAPPRALATHRQEI